MWVVSILTIGRASPNREFSYFSKEEIAEGSIVHIRARGTESFGLTTGCAPLRELKQDLRSATFSLQKIAGSGQRIFTREFLRASFEIANEHACSAGAVIYDLVPSAILEHASILPEVIFTPTKDKRSAHKMHIEVLSAAREKRMTAYLDLAQSAELRKGSLLIVAPTITEAGRIAASLRAEIPVIELHGALTKKVMRENWKRLIVGGPAVIVGTPLALSCPRADLHAIVIERDGARGYLREERPFLDIDTCAAILAEALGARLILASAAPSLLSSLRSSRHEARPYEMPPLPQDTKAQMEIIDMRPPKIEDTKGEQRAKKQVFELFSPSVRDAIAHSLSAGGRVLLLGARHGLATQTVCDDCGSVHSCEFCGTALVLHEKGAGRSERQFECSYCGALSPAHARCRICTSWRLSALGVGLERIAAEAQKTFPDAPLFVADEKTLSKQKESSLLTLQFEKEEAALLCGTEGIVPYLSKSVDLLVIVSIDSLLFLPEYSSTERAVQTLFELYGLVRDRMIVQTRAPEHPALLALEKRDVRDFTKEELALRQKFSYPPFSTLVRITFSGPKTRIAPEVASLLEVLAAYGPKTIVGRPPVRRGKGGRVLAPHVREHILLRLPEGSWPDRELLARLRALPPSIEVRVNPRSIFSD